MADFFICICFDNEENGRAARKDVGGKLKERPGYGRVNRKRLRQYMPVTRYWHWPIMAVGLADGRNLAEKSSGDLRKWGWNWWEASLFLFLFLSSLELSVRCSFKILFRSRNRRYRLVFSIRMSTNWRHVPTRLEYSIIYVIANKKSITWFQRILRRFLKYS